MLEELKLVKNHIEEKQSFVHIQNKKYSEVKQKLLESTKLQLDFLDVEFNNFISCLKSHKHEIEEQIKNLYKKQM